MKKLLALAAILIAAAAFMQPRHLSWVAIGDSITYLNEHPDETGSRIGSGYMSRVVKALPYITYINQGHNGWTSGGIAAKIDSLGLLKADIYSVFLGTNDWWQGRPLGSFTDYTGNTGNASVYGSFRIIINKLRSLNKKARIILITPMQRGDFVYILNKKNNAYGSYRPKNGQLLEAFAEAVKTIAVYEHASLVDLYHAKGMEQENMVNFKRLKDPQTEQYKNYTYPAYTGIPFHPETDEYPYPPEAIAITYDGLHPSDQGYALIADMLVGIMKMY